MVKAPVRIPNELFDDYPTVAIFAESKRKCQSPKVNGTGITPDAPEKPD